MWKARDWDHPLFIPSLDVEKAFDQIEAFAVEEAMHAHGALVWPWWPFSGSSRVNVHCLGWQV